MSLRAALLIALISERAAADEVFLSDTLDCGLQCMVLEDHRAPTVAVQVWVRAGTAHERPGLRGVAHLVEHLQFLRPEWTGPEGFDRRLALSGAVSNARTLRDATVYNATVSALDWKKALALEFSRLSPLSATDSLVREESRVIGAEVRSVGERLDSVCGAMLNSALFPWHPYDRESLKPDSDLDRLTADDAHLFFRKFYRPWRIAVVVTGDLGAAEALKEMKSLGAHLKPLEPPSRGPSATEAAASEEAWDGAALPPEPRERDLHLRHSGSISEFRVAFSVPGFGGDGERLWPVVVDLLAGGRAGLLDRSLTESLGLASRCEGLYEPGQLAGVVSLKARLRPDADSHLARSKLDQLLDGLATRGPEETDLKRSLRRLGAEAARLLKTHEDQAGCLGLEWLRGASPSPPTGGCPSVSREDIRQALAVYASPERRVWLWAEGDAGASGEKE
jgi:zinc protease